MSVYSGPEIANDGLVFNYDIGNTQKSWKGVPTVNLFGDAVNYTGLNSYWYLLDNATNYFLLSSSYNSWCMSYGCTLAASTQYTVSFEYKTSIAGTLTIDNDGVDDNTWNATINTTTSWQKYTFTRTQITAGALTLYFRRNSGGDIEVRNVQIEANAFATPFVKGTRSTTQAIVDLTGTNTVTAASLTYASDGTFSFNGTSNYLDCGNSTAVQLPTAITMEAWVNPVSTTGLGNIMSKNFNSGYRFRIDSGSLWWYVSGNAITGGSVPNGRWSHCVVTGSSAGLSSYINGVLVASNSTAFAPAAPTLANLYIGTYGPSSEPFNGAIAVAKIYNRALTAAEILQNFNALRERYFGYQQLIYTASSNVTLTNNGTQDVSMFKNADNNVWNGEVRSTESFTAPCTIEFSKQAASGDNGLSYAMIGWDENPTSDTSYGSIDHASYPYRTDSYQVYNNGSQVHASGTWDVNKRFYIVYDTDGFIRHYNGSTLLYSANYGTNKVVYVDSSFYSVNSTFGGFSNVKVARSSWNGTNYV